MGCPAGRPGRHRLDDPLGGNASRAGLVLITGFEISKQSSQRFVFKPIKMVLAYKYRCSLMRPGGAETADIHVHAHGLWPVLTQGARRETGGNEDAADQVFAGKAPVGTMSA
jgi:hypothetical protein